MNSEPVLNADRVDAIFRDCLFRQDEDTNDCVKAEGIVSNVGFHPERLNGHRTEIEAMLHELPPEFQLNGGEGGWSFLNACYDKHGNQWTGMHQQMEQLFQLGIAIGKVKCLLPRELWNALPGQMPYYAIT